jgi:regulator of cell morphogenesis and NO signaling
MKTMPLSRNKINRDATVAGIVNTDYRAADIFRKYGIEYCCGGRFPLYVACQMNDVNEDTVVRELEEAVREVNTANMPDFTAWSIDFLTDYIVNVHHHYLRHALPRLSEHVDRFAEGHKKKIPVPR